MYRTFLRAFLLLGIISLLPLAAQAQVKIGLNYPKTGPYFTQGLDQLRAAKMAVEEINAAGGIKGQKIELVMRDSKSKADVTTKNVTDLIDNHGVKMVFGGSASSVAVAAEKVCQDKKTLFFGTLTYSNATTGKAAKRHMFRECYNAWQGAKVLADYINKNFAGKKYYYITADYTWGHSTEASMRKFTNTENKSQHKGVLTPFPTATARDFKRALEAAKAENPDVLVLVLFGQDMATAVNIATGWGLKKKMQLVVPNLTLGMAEGSGPENMSGVLGALPWTWKIPYKYNYSRGRAFVEKFDAKYKRYPSTSGASAYTILHEYKAAVERAGSFDSAKVIKALEGHTYTSLKDKQTWREFDHQSVQTVYAVRCNAPNVVRADKYNLDYFEVIDKLDGKSAAQTFEEWKSRRLAAGVPPYLERLPGESVPSEVAAGE